MALGGRHVFHGVGWDVRHRRHRARRGVPAGGFLSAADADALESADGVHDRRTVERAFPREGGYYAWVRRALGNIWGFQEAWLSLAASIFDMAIYPTLFVAYLNATGSVVRCGTSWSDGWSGSGDRLRGAEHRRRARGGTTSLWLFALLSAPFALLVLLAPFQFGGSPALHHAGLRTSV